MKKFIIAAAMCCALAFSAQAQSLSDLFNKSKNTNSDEGNPLSGLLETILSNTGIIETDITGTWTYAEADCKFTSEDLAKQAGGMVAATKVSDMLSKVYTKTGIVPNAFKFEFKSDNSFILSLGSKTLNGEYTLNGNDITLSYKVPKGLKAASVNAHIQKAGDNLSVLFKADKLLTLFEQLCGSSKVAALKTAADLAKGYDGMMIGFEMNRIK